MSAPTADQAALSRFALPLRAALVAYWLGIFTASHVPRTPDLLPIQGGDKIMHCSAYALLALLCALDRHLRGWASRAVLLRVAAVLALYGIADELLQYPIEGRTCDALDWVADLLGISAGLATFVLLRSFRRRLAAE